MTKTYTNIPSNKTESSSDKTIRVFDQYNSLPLELNSTALTAMVGYLESRGFSADSSENIAVALLKQAKADGFNPFLVLQTVKKLESVELSNLIGQILNYNRLKTSTLGTILKTTPVEDIKRNIKA